MRLQILMLTIACLTAAPAWAGAGLTSAGVDPTPANNQQGEPTLAQVAPQGTQGTTTGTVAGTITPGVASAATTPGGAASVAGVAGTNGAAGGVAVVPVAVVPPPPPDPATLPVSVIRPVNKAGGATTTGADAPTSGDSATTSLQQTRAAKAPSTSPPGVAMTSALPAPSSSPAASRPAAGLAPRTDVAARAAPESSTDQPADASASGFIFYVGVGIAATILLLSLAAFFRGGGAEVGKPRSM